MADQRLPTVGGDDGTWGAILRQYLMKEHYNDDTNNSVNGGHQKITVRAGTTAAGTAPIKLTSGSLMTTPEAGAVEFNTNSLYFTETTGPTRKKVATFDYLSPGSTGDIYYNSGGTFTRLGIGGSNNILTVSSGIPTWSSSISADVITDGSTNKAYTATEKTKLSGIASGAEVNVQSDWNAVSGDAQILNKPTIPTNNNQLTNGAGYVTTAGISWVSQASSTTANTGNGYICTGGSQVVVTLPSSPGVGGVVRVVGSGSGGWKVGQPASVQIKFNSATTTSGTSGYLQSANNNDSVELLYTASNVWTVISSVGNITIG